MLWRTNLDRPILFTPPILALFRLLIMNSFHVWEEKNWTNLHCFSTEHQIIDAHASIFLSTILTDKMNETVYAQRRVIAILSAYTTSLDWSYQISDSYHLDSQLYIQYSRYSFHSLSFTFTQGNRQHTQPLNVCRRIISPFFHDFSLSFSYLFSLRFGGICVLIEEGKYFFSASLLSFVPDRRSQLVDKFDLYVVWSVCMISPHMGYIKKGMRNKCESKATWYDRGVTYNERRWKKVPQPIGSCLARTGEWHLNEAEKSIFIMFYLYHLFPFQTNCCSYCWGVLCSYVRYMYDPNIWTIYYHSLFSLAWLSFCCCAPISSCSVIFKP